GTPCRVHWLLRREWAGEPGALAGELGEELGGREAGQAPHLPTEVRLVGVAGEAGGKGKRTRVRPARQAEEAPETDDAGERLRPVAERGAAAAVELSFAQTELLGQLVDPDRRTPPHRRGDVLHRWVRGRRVGQPPPHRVLQERCNFARHPRVAELR